MDFLVCGALMDENAGGSSLRQPKREAFWSVVSRARVSYRAPPRAVESLAGGEYPVTPTKSEQVTLVPIFLFKKSVTRCTVPPLSQKVTLGLPVRL